MGSLGWFQCYWCQWWQEGGYIIDWIGYPLCDRCFDWYVKQDGGPWRPDGRDKAANHIKDVLGLKTNAARLVAEFLVPWHAP